MVLWWLNLAGSSIGFTVGSILLKKFADTGGMAVLALSFLVLAMSNLFYVQVIRTGLGQGIVASSMSQIILVACLGVLIFGERLSVYQAAGVVMATVSIALIMGAGAGPADT